MSVNYEKLGEFDPLDSSLVSPDFYILGQNRQKTVPFLPLLPGTALDLQSPQTI